MPHLPQDVSKVSTLNAGSHSLPRRQTHVWLSGLTLVYQNLDFSDVVTLRVIEAFETALGNQRDGNQAEKKKHAHLATFLSLYVLKAPCKHGLLLLKKNYDDDDDDDGDDDDSDNDADDDDDGDDDDKVARRSSHDACCCCCNHHSEYLVNIWTAALVRSVCEMAGA